MKKIDHAELSRILLRGVQELSLQLSEEQCALLLDYLALLSKWNAVYNLTAVRDPIQMVTQHLLDSLTVVPFFSAAKNVLDVGAGGGLPGMVLAIARPDMKIALIDTVHKKTAFLTQVKAELGLANVMVHTGRVEELSVTDKFDVITSRAFADLSDFIDWSEHLLAENGEFIAMKGVASQDELARLPSKWKIQQVKPLKVPGLVAERHLIFIERNIA